MKCVFKYLFNMYQIVFFLPHLLILVGGDGNELGLLEDVRPKGGVRQLEDVVGPHQVEPRLVLVHRVEDGLQVPKRRGIKMGWLGRPRNDNNGWCDWKWGGWRLRSFSSLPT